MGARELELISSAFSSLLSEWQREVHGYDDKGTTIATVSHVLRRWLGGSFVRRELAATNTLIVATEAQALLERVREIATQGDVEAFFMVLAVCSSIEDICLSINTEEARHAAETWRRLVETHVPVRLWMTSVDAGSRSWEWSG